MALYSDYQPLSVDAIRSLDALGGSMLTDTLKACYWHGDYTSVSNAIDAGAFGGEFAAGEKQHDRLCELVFRNHGDRDRGSSLIYKALGKLKDDPDELARLLMHGLTGQKAIGEMVYVLINEGADLHRPVTRIGKDKVRAPVIVSPAQAYLDNLLANDVGAFPWLLAESIDRLPTAEVLGTGTRNLLQSAMQSGRNAFSELLFSRLDLSRPELKDELASMLESSHREGKAEMVARLLALGATPRDDVGWAALSHADPERYEKGSVAHAMLVFSGNSGMLMTNGEDIVNVALQKLLDNGLNPNLIGEDSLLEAAFFQKNKTAFAILLEAGADTSDICAHPSSSTEIGQEMIRMAQAMNAKRAVEGILSAARQHARPGN